MLRVFMVWKFFWWIVGIRSERLMMLFICAAVRTSMDEGYHDVLGGMCFSKSL